MSRPTEIVKGVSRREWCAQISKKPRKVSPERYKQLCETIKKGRQAQIAKDGALFGGKPYRFNAPKPPRPIVVEVHKVKRDLTLHRQAVDIFEW